MAVVHVRVLGHFVGPHVLEVGGHQMGEEVVFAFPAFAAESALDEGLVTARKSARDETKAGQF